jgi:WD40 repeat protein
MPIGFKLPERHCCRVILLLLLSGFLQLTAVGTLTSFVLRADDPPAQNRQDSPAADDSKTSPDEKLPIVQSDEFGNFLASLRKKVVSLRKARKFEEIDALADKFRTSQERLGSGRSKLSALNDALGARPGPKTSDFDAKIAQLEEWVEQRPESYTARLALAKTWDRYAWFARGGSFASKVSEKAYATFSERSEKAWQILEEAERLPTRDADGCSLSIQVALALGWPPERVEEVCWESLRRDPLSLETILDAVFYFLPRWYGNSGDLELFAEKAVEKTKDRWGQAAYAAIVQTTEYVHNYTVFEDFTFSWSKVKRGYEDWCKVFPPDGRRRERHCRLAYAAGDRTVAHQFFEAIGPTPHVMSVWPDQDNFDFMRRWADPDFTSGDQADIIESVKVPAFSLAWTSNPELIVVTESLSDVSVVNTRTHERRVLTKTYRPNNPICVDSDAGVVYFATTDGSVRAYTLITGKSMQLGEHGAQTTTIALSPDGLVLATAGISDTVKIWNVESGDLAGELKSDGRHVSSIDIGRVGDFLALGGEKGAVELWSIAKRERTTAWTAHPKGINVIALSPDGSLLATASAKELKLWKIDNQELVRSFSGIPQPIGEMKFTPDGTRLVGTTRHGKPRTTPGQVIVWDVESGKRLKQYDGHKTGITGVAVSPDGTVAATTSYDTSVRLWKLP